MSAYHGHVSVMDPKAILDGRTYRGVPAGAIIAIAASSVCLAGFLGIFLAVGGASFIVAAILSMITLVPMMAGVLALDRVEPEPMFMLVMAFLWGAGTSTILSLIFENLGIAALQPGLGDNSESAVLVILAPVTEETMKGLVLFGIFLFRRRDFGGITDGIVYAATTALGFAAAENIVYYIGSAQGGATSLAAIFIVRGVLSPFCHPVFTSMTGIALALAVRRKSPAARILLPLGGLLLAMLLHALWNGSLVFGVGGLGIAFLVTVGILITLLVAVFRERKRTVAEIQACAAEYVPTGLVTYADLAMLSSLKTRKQARTWARSTHGKSGFNAMRDYQMACTKLTTLHDRASSGLVSRQVFESQRSALLALMKVARQAFLGPRYMAVPMMVAPGVRAQYQVPAPRPYVPPQPVQPGPTQPAPVQPSPSYQPPQSAQLLQTDQAPQPVHTPPPAQPYQPPWSPPYQPPVPEPLYQPSVTQPLYPSPPQDTTPSS